MTEFREWKGIDDTTSVFERANSSNCSCRSQVFSRSIPNPEWLPLEIFEMLLTELINRWRCIQFEIDWMFRCISSSSAGWLLQCNPLLIHIGLVLMVQLHGEFQISFLQALFDPLVDTGVQFRTKMILPVTSFTLESLWSGRLFTEIDIW